MTYILSRLCQFQNKIQNKLVGKRLYQDEKIRLWLPKLQVKDLETQKIRNQGLKEDWEEDIDRVLCY